MTSHYSNWHICLFSLAFVISATTAPTSAFSSRGGKRAHPKRKGRSSSTTTFTSTRVHSMLSGIRTFNKKCPVSQPLPLSSVTVLSYRSVDDSHDDMDSLWLAALSQEARQVSTSRDSEATALLHRDDSSAELRPKSISKTKDEDSREVGLIETAKAFIPVAVEIGMVAAAAAAANVHNLN